MKKIFIKLLTSAVITATLIAPNFPGRVYASNGDALYANCYNAVVKAKLTGNQLDINAARAAIGALVDTKADFAIGEFSKQLDQVQQPILIKICNAISKIQSEDNSATYNQIDITNTYNVIPAILPSEWRSSYLSAIDKVQKNYQQKAIDAWEKYTTSKSIEDYLKAMMMFNDITNNVAFNEQQAYIEWKVRVCTGE